MKTSTELLESLSKNKIKSLILSHSSMRQIFKFLNISYNHRSIAKFNEIVHKYQLQKKYLVIKNHPKIKVNIFDQINTKEKAYWLGFIAADGYIPKKGKKLAFTMSTKDENHFNRFIHFVNADPTKKRYYIGKYKNPMFQISINSVIFTNHIKKWGIISPKSKTLRFPSLINNSMKQSFLLGLLDGDGDQNGNLSSGSEQLLTDIKKLFNINNKITYKKNEWGSCFNLKIPLELRQSISYKIKYNLKRKQAFSEEFLKKNYNTCKCGKKKLIQSKKCQICFNTRKYNKNDLIKLIKEHKSILQVAKSLNISNTAVKKHFINHNIVHWSNKPSLDTRLIKAYYKKIKSIKTTAKKFKTSSYLIQKIIKNTPTYKEQQNNKNKILKLKSTVLKMKNNMTFFQIAQKLRKNVTYIKGIYYRTIKK